MRPAGDDELDRLHDTFDRFGGDFLESWLSHADAEIWIRPGKVRAVHIVRKILGEQLRAHPEPVPKIAGLFLGEVDRYRFHLSLEGAYEVGRRTKENRVFVSDKAAQLFLYGRDVLGEGIERWDPGVKRGNVALVTTLRGDVIGLAEVLMALPGNGRVLEPLADRGWYLREGG